MSANELSKQESPDNISESSQLEEHQKKTSKNNHRLGNKKNNNQVVQQPLSREERKLQQYVLRIEEQARLEEAASLKRKRSKPNPENEKGGKTVEASETPKPIEEPIIQVTPAPVLLNPLVVPQTSTQQMEQTVQTKLRLNPKLKMKEKHHIFLYLSECYDKCQDYVSKLNSTDTQAYSPTRVNKVDTSNLLPINQEVYQETIVLTKNFKSQFQICYDSLQQLNDYQKDFINKQLDKKNMETILRENKLQIYKKQEKTQISNGKLFQKKY